MLVDMPTFKKTKEDEENNLLQTNKTINVGDEMLARQLELQKEAEEK